MGNMQKSIWPIRGSKLPLTWQCPSWLEPAAFDLVDDSGPEAQMGTLVHECLAELVAGNDCDDTFVMTLVAAVTLTIIMQGVGSAAAVFPRAGGRDAAAV